MLYVDGETNQVAIGTSDLNSDSNPAALSIGRTNHAIHVAGSSVAANTTGGGFFTSRQKDNGSTGWITIGSWDDGTNRQVYYGGGGWGVEEATRHVFYSGGYDAGNGGSIECLAIAVGESVFNDASHDKDFRVESNNDANALFVDGANGKVTIGGQLNTSSGVSGIMRTSQRTAISGTTNTTIVTTVGAGGSSAAAAQVIVYGSDNSSRSFMDTLNVGSSSGIVVAQSSTLAGSPHGRTYAISGTNLNLQLASGASGYAVNCAVTTLDFPF